MVMLLCVFIVGCGNEEARWERVVESKVVDIEIVGVGGFASPNSVRVWKLENGMKISMPGWKNEEVCIGDNVAKFKRIGGANSGATRWKKVP